ncbi:MAG: YdcF family protein [Myxococcota bacterium]
MFFFLSKTLDLLVDPWWWAFALVLAGVALLVRGARRRLGLVLAHTGLAVLVVFSLPAVSNRLWRALEAGEPDTFRAEATYDAVVLLGGAVSPFGSTPEAVAWNDNVDRLTRTYELLASGKAKVAILSGGSLGTPSLPTEAEYLARQLEAWGIAKERLVVEDQARNTRENATFTKALVTSRGLGRVLVVTSAFHMPRAAGCFRAAGVDFDTLKVDYRMREPSRDGHVFPRAEYLADSSKVLREVLGRWVYRLMGYTR